MKKISLSLAGFVLTSITTIGGSVYAAEPDPVLTEKSLETFDVEMGDLSLSLPIELRSQAVPKKINEQKTDLSIGNIDISYQLTDRNNKTSKLVKGWVEFEGAKTHCDAREQLGLIRKVILKNEKDSFKINRVKNEKFDGLVTSWSQTFRGKLAGYSLEMIDHQKMVCYNISLAIDGFDGFTRSEIKMALSPLTNALKKSFAAHINQKGTDNEKI